MLNLGKNLEKCSKGYLLCSKEITSITNKLKIKKKRISSKKLFYYLTRIKKTNVITTKHKNKANLLARTKKNKIKLILLNKRLHFRER